MPFPAIATCRGKIAQRRTKGRRRPAAQGEGVDQRARLELGYFELGYFVPPLARIGHPRSVRTRTVYTRMAYTRMV